MRKNVQYRKVRGTARRIVTTAKPKVKWWPMKTRGGRR